MVSSSEFVKELFTTWDAVVSCREQTLGLRLRLLRLLTVRSVLAPTAQARLVRTPIRSSNRAADDRAHLGDGTVDQQAVSPLGEGKGRVGSGTGGHEEVVGGLELECCP